MRGMGMKATIITIVSNNTQFIRINQRFFVETLAFLSLPARAVHLRTMINNITLIMMVVDIIKPAKILPMRLIIGSIVPYSAVMFPAILRSE